MKNFKVVEYKVVTFKKTYWSEAESKEQALEQMMNGDLGKAVTKEVIEDKVLSYEVKKIKTL